MYHFLEENKEENLSIIYWDSISEPFDFELGKNKSAMDSSTEDKEKKDKDDRIKWYGVESYDKVVRCVKYGWPEGAERMSVLSDGISGMATNFKRKRVRGEFGDELDIHQVMSGRIDKAWSRRERKKRVSQKNINFIVDIAAPWDVTADALFWRGAAMLKLADILERAGYSVGIHAAIGASDLSNKLGTAQFVPIKRNGIPLDIQSICSTIALSGYFRAAMFRGLCASCDINNENIRHYFGSPCHKYIHKAKKHFSFLRDAIIQPPIISKEGAEKWIKDTIAKIEGENK